MPFKSIPLLGSNLPPSEPSIVKNVVSVEPSVPLNIISESPAWASIVILPDVVVKLIAASPAVKSSAALDTSMKDNTQLTFISSACPFEPSVVGRLNAVSP